MQTGDDEQDFFHFSQFEAGGVFRGRYVSVFRNGLKFGGAGVIFRKEWGDIAVENKS